MHFVRVAADYRADFVVFPEFLALQTLSMHAQMLSPAAAVSARDRTPRKAGDATSPDPATAAESA